MKITEEILRSVQSVDAPYIVGIDGLACSGKTTFSSILASALTSKGFQVISLYLDDFIFPKNIRYNLKMDEWYCYYHLQWRYEYLVKEVLLPLHRKEGLKKSIEIYNKSHDNYILKNIFVDPKVTPITLVEGVFLHRPALLPFFHFTIFIQAPTEKIRLERALSRDTYIGTHEEIVRKYQKRYFPAEKQYLDECFPLKKATKILSSFSPINSCDV